MTAGDEDKLDGRLKLTHEFTQEDRLAGSHFPVSSIEPLLGFDSVNQSRQSLQIEWVAVEEARVRRHTERRFPKSK